ATRWRKRQRTAALQDADALAIAPFRCKKDQRSLGEAYFRILNWIGFRTLFLLLGAGALVENRAAAAVPVITDFSPASGAPGTVVTISGLNFLGVVGVTFNGAIADITPISATQISATVPLDATTGPISVSTSAGFATSAPKFFSVSPFIIDFNPNGGPPGTLVAINGVNLDGVTAVAFSGKDAAFVITGLNQVQAFVPDGATSGPISVVAQSGTAVSRNPFVVTGTGPFISGFSPDSGVPGTVVVIDGNNFTGANAVRFNGTNAASFFVTADTQIQATVPAQATTGLISVTTPLGTGNSVTNFTVTSGAAVITNFFPRFGPPGTSVVIDGENFTGITAVNFDGTNATFTLVSLTQIHSTVPAEATTGPINIVNAGGTGSSRNDFIVTGPGPIITDFDPAFGGSGTLVVIDGANFAGATAVQFNGTNAASFSVTSLTQIHAFVPDGATNGPISVTTPSGTGVSGNSFIVIGAAPLITDFRPIGGAPGASVVINGANFTGATNVLFNGTTVSNLTVTSATQLQTTVPAGATTGPITVSSLAGTGVSSNKFIVAPRLNAFSPTNGPIGSTVMIFGVNLLETTRVLFNGVVANFTAQSQTNLQAFVPTNATSGPISVNTPGGGVATTNSFNVILAADLSLLASASPATAIVGSNLTYNITVTNRGPNIATGVVVTNQLPASVQFVSALSSQGSFAFANGIFTASLGNLTNSGVAKISLVVLPKSAGALTNLLTVEGNEADLVLTNNAITIVTTVLPAAGVQMQIALSGGNIIISWPSTAIGFFLESTSSLAPPITWNEVIDTPSDDGVQKTVTTDAGSGEEFYRLRNP
ncbi:MAG: hypothetical protein ABI651_14070, partial [Verrucomicrobiota bacterium]